MKPIVVKILIGIVGFAGGFGAGYFAHKKINEVQFEEVSAEEFAALENSVLTASKGPSGDSKGTDGQEPSKGVGEPSDALGAAQKLPEEPDDIRKALQGKVSYIDADKETKIAYEKLWQSTKSYSNEENANNVPVVPVEPGSVDEEDEADSESPSEEDFDGEFLEQIEREAQEAGAGFTDPPHQIDLADFYNEWPEYDEVVVNWYEPDNTWIDDHEDPIVDIGSYTGIPGKNPFTEEPLTDDIDTRFWVNPRYGTKYEFIRHHISWAEASGDKE